MASPQPIVAIGRSRYLYDSIKHLARTGHRVAAIVTDEAYAEYDVSAEQFGALAEDVGAVFRLSSSLSRESDFLSELVAREDVRVAISANWRYKIPTKILELFPSGVLNFHLGSLPDFKGNATVNWSILAGEDHIYGNVHKMAPELDAGDVVSRMSIPITDTTYVGDVIASAEALVPDLYAQALARLADDPHHVEVPGTTSGLRCYPRRPEDGQIDWTRPAEMVSRLVRASSRPYGGAFSHLNGAIMTIWRARAVAPSNPFLAVPGQVLEVRPGTGTVVVACGDGALEIEQVEQDGQCGAPAERVKSIRARFTNGTVGDVVPQSTES